MPGQPQAAQPARHGFRPCRAPHTRAPAPVLNRCPPPTNPIGLLNRAPAIPAAARKSTPTPMTESTLPDYAIPARADPLTRRRLFFTLIVLASMAGLIWLLSFALTAGGFGVLDFILVVLFAVTLPWSVIGFWNATIGLFIMRTAQPVACVTPVLARVSGDEPITAKTAILWCVRNEDTGRIIRNIEPMMEGLVASGIAAQFHVFILSDTNYPEIAAIEGPRFAALAAQWQDRIAFTYRRRSENTAFKAGNIFDFCNRWGAAYDFAVVLD